jgi:hypothetical protein
MNSQAPWKDPLGGDLTNRKVSTKNSKIHNNSASRGIGVHDSSVLALQDPTRHEDPHNNMDLVTGNPLNVFNYLNF